MDRIDKLLRTANPVRPGNEPKVNAETELRRVLEGLPASEAAADWDAGLASLHTSPLRGRPPLRWLAAVAVAAVGALAVALLVLTQGLAPQHSTPPAGTPTPSNSTAAPGPEGWRVQHLQLTGPGGTPGALIQVDVPPGFELGGDVPNESYDSESAKIVRVGTTSAVLAQIYYGKVIPQRDPLACAGSAEDYVELDSAPVDVPYNTGAPGTVPPRFVYRVIVGTQLRASLGITTRPPGASVGSCEEFHSIDSVPAGNILAASDQFQFNAAAPGWLSTARSPLSPSFASMEEARAYLSSAEYQSYKRMFTSIRIIQP